MARSTSRTKHLAQLPVLASPRPIKPSSMRHVLSALDKSGFFKVPYSKSPRCPDIFFLSHPSRRRCKLGGCSRIVRRRMRKSQKREEAETAQVKTSHSIAECLVNIGCAAGGFGTAFVELKRETNKTKNEFAASNSMNPTLPIFVVTPPPYEKWSRWEWWIGPGDAGVLVEARKETKGKTKETMYF